MATKTFEELKQLAIQIRDEKTNKQNTATRVGTAMLEHINKLEQDYYDKSQTDEELKERDDKLTELEEKTNDNTKNIKDNSVNDIKNHSQNSANIDYINSLLREVLDDEFAVVDKNGNVVFKVGKNGIDYIGREGEILSLKKLIERLKSVSTDSESNFVITDFIGNIIAGINENGLRTIDANITSADYFYITDKNGNIAFSVTNNGVNYVGKGEVQKLKSISVGNEDNFVITDFIGNIITGINEKGLRTVDANFTSAEDFYITDKNGNIAFSVTNNGVNYTGKGEGSTGTSIMESNYPADIVMNILYGQSLSQQGSYSGKEDLCNILSFQNGNSLTGLTNPDNTETCDTYFGSQFIAAKNTGLATAMGFTNKVWMELLKKENGINVAMKDGITPYFDFQLIGSVPGNPGDSWGLLADSDGVQYKRLLKSVEYAKKIALSNNCTFRVGTLSWMQGENSADKINSLKLYYDKLWIIFSNLNTDIKNITGQEEDVKFITYQMASHKSPTQVSSGALDGTPLALLQIGLDKGYSEEGYELEESVKTYLHTTLMNRDYIYAGPTLYPYEHSSDGVHMVNDSYHKVGALFGVISKRLITDKVDWMPIYPVSHTINSRSDGKYLLTLKFHVPYPPLVLDFSNIKGEQPNYGFSIKNNSQQEIIESISIKRDDTINILCKENPNSLFLYYAESGTQGGGNLRDSQGYSIITDINGQPYACHNWAPIFKYQLI